MRRYMKFLVNIPIIALLIGGVTVYNYATNQQRRQAIHVEIMGRLMDGVHAKELKPLPWEEVAAGKSSQGDLTALNGQKVVLAGYGKPSNPDYIRDLGSVGSIGMDPCCPKPISYRKVTELALTPLPYHCYFWKEAPVAVDVTIAGQKPIQFVADQPNFYRGTLEVKQDAGRTVLALKDAERIDTSKGSVFDKAPAAAAAAAKAAAS